MGFREGTRATLAVGFLVSGVLLVVGQLLRTGLGEEGELAAWLLAHTWAPRSIQALIFGVLGAALAGRAGARAALLFDGVLFFWVLIGLPIPDAAAAWPEAAGVGLLLAGALLWIMRRSFSGLDSTPALVAGALLGLVLPTLWIARASAPVLVVEGREVHPRLARPDAPSLMLIVLDGLGKRRLARRPLAQLQSLERTGTSFSRAVAPAPRRERVLATLFSQGSEGLAGRLGGEGILGAYFGEPIGDLAAAFQESEEIEGGGGEIAARMSRWLGRIAGARFFLALVLPTEGYTSTDLEERGGDREAAAQRATDRTLGLCLAELERRGLDATTLVAVVSTHDSTVEPSLRQACLEVPLLLIGPGIPAGRRIDAVVSTAELPSSLLVRLGLASGPDPLLHSGDLARFSDADTTGVRQGDWTLWRTARGKEVLHQLIGDPYEEADLSAERPDRVAGLRALLVKGEEDG